MLNVFVNITCIVDVVLLRLILLTGNVDVDFLDKKILNINFLERYTN